MDPLLTNAELAHPSVMGRVTLCRRCGQKPVCYPDSGLCHRCPALAEPTDHPPGSAEKIELMRDRVAAGLPPFADGDLDPRDLVAADLDPTPFFLFRS